MTKTATAATRTTTRTARKSFFSIETPLRQE
jgi:hypothetical protein